MKCIKCKADIPDDSIFCCYCGKKQTTRPKKRKPRSVGNGSGTVYKRGKTWTAQYRRWIGDDGIALAMPINRTKGGFSTAKEAREYLPVLKAEPITKERIKYQTLKQLYDEWISCKQGKISHSTVNCYNAAIKHFDKLYNIPFCNITVDDLQSCIDNSGMGAQTKRNMRTVIGLLYKHAILHKQIKEHINYADYLQIDAREAADRRGFTAAQLDVIRKGAEAQPPVGIADQIYVGCYLGFRPTELINLTVEDYDADNQAFHGGIKTAAGKNRVVTISPKIAHIVSRCVQDKPAEAAVFPNPKTGRKWGINYFRKDFYKTLDALGIKNPKDNKGRYIFTPHAMRHTFATLMKNINAPEKDKLGLIGHTDSKMLQYYQDISYDDLRKITDNI